MFDVESIRRDFPILGREVYGKPLVYLDNAATTQKPQCVIDSISDAYRNVNANVHRGIHFLSQEATDMLEAARTQFHRCRQHRGDHIHPRHYREHEPSGQLFCRSIP